MDYMIPINQDIQNLQETNQREEEEPNARFTELCQHVRENRSDKTSILLQGPDYSLINDAMAIEFGQAIRENNKVEDLLIETEDINRSSTHGITYFIAKSPSLRRLQLSTRRNTDGVGDQYLIAASLNNKIQEVEIWGIFGALALTSFLRSPREKLVSLTLDFSHLSTDTQETELDADFIANAIGAHPTLKKLHLCSQIHQCFAPKILNHLIDHASIKSLRIDHISNLCSQIIRNILESSTPLQSLELECSGPIDNIMSGLHEHTTVQSVMINLTHQSRKGAIRYVANMLFHNRSVESITLYCWELNDTINILEPLATNSTLKTLEIFRTCEDKEPFEQACQKLAKLLPHATHLKTLKMEGDRLPDSTLANKNLLHGLQGNPSLTSCTISWFDNDEDKIHTFYTTRNEYRTRLSSAKKPEMLMIFNELLTHHECGLSIVFETLRDRDNWFNPLPESEHRPIIQYRRIRRRHY